MRDMGRQFSAWVDGQGKFAEVVTLQPPSLTWRREGHVGGGMVGEVEYDLHLEALQATMVFRNYDEQALDLFGVAPGNLLPFQFRRHLIDTRRRTQRDLVIHLLGRVDIEWEEWDRGSLGGIRIPIAVDVYRRYVDGIEKLHIDPERGIFRPNGIDGMTAVDRSIGRR